MTKKGHVNIRGKDYKTVALRVAEFRASHPIADGWGLLSEELDAGESHVKVRAWVSDPQGRVVATGHATERIGSSNINKTAALENCETSAFGRALAAAGWPGEEMASADEIVAKMQAQGLSKKGRKHDPSFTKHEQARFMAQITSFGWEYDELIEELHNRGVRPARPSQWPQKSRDNLTAKMAAGQFAKGQGVAP